MGWRTVAAGLLLVAVSACAVPYGSDFFGSTDKEMEPGIWRVTMRGNGYTTYETIQTYWLYRCAELALEKGYDGVEVLSGIQLTRPLAQPGIQVAATSRPVYIPMYIPSGPPRPVPSLSADVRMLKQPFEPVTGRIFSAAALKAALEPYVKGEKCSQGNVCPHVHTYLHAPL